MPMVMLNMFVTQGDYEHDLELPAARRQGVTCWRMSVTLAQNSCKRQLHAEDRSNELRALEDGLWGLGTRPGFGIGQRALLVRTEEGNLLWDCIAHLDQATVDAIREPLEDGRAFAALAADYEAATRDQVKGSPTFVLNHGRQRLYGNVGYRIIEANIEELLRDRGEMASWC